MLANLYFLIAPLLSSYINYWKIFQWCRQRYLVTYQLVLSKTVNCLLFASVFKVSIYAKGQAYQKQRFIPYLILPNKAPQILLLFLTIVWAGWAVHAFVFHGFILYCNWGGWLAGPGLQSAFFSIERRIDGLPHMEAAMFQERESESCKVSWALGSSTTFY